MIRVKINSQSLEINEPSTLEKVISIIGFDNGHFFSVAVNQVVIPREDHDKYIIQDGDEILIFGAVKGG